MCYLDFTFSAQGWGSSYGVALAVPLALWTSFFFFFFSGLRHYQKKKSTLLRNIEIKAKSFEMLGRYRGKKEF